MTAISRNNSSSSARTAFFVILVLIAGCGSLPSNKAGLPGASGIADGIDPSGKWTYEELGQQITLVLDKNGNGEYEWKDGTFRTRHLADQVWTGTWHQPVNDREGGFTIKMNADYSAGKGRWWYTRIGENKNPKRPGGRFNIERTQSP